MACGKSSAHEHKSGKHSTFVVGFNPSIPGEYVDQCCVARDISTPGRIFAYRALAAKHRFDIVFGVEEDMLDNAWGKEEIPVSPVVLLSILWHSCTSQLVPEFDRKAWRILCM